MWSNQAGSRSLTRISGSADGNLFDKFPPDKAHHRRLMLSSVRRTGQPVEFVDDHEGGWEVGIRPTPVADALVIWQRNGDRRVAAEEGLSRSLLRALTIQEGDCPGQYASLGDQARARACSRVSRIVAATRGIL